MSGVYKIPMVRMSNDPEDGKEMTDEPANVRVYNSTVQKFTGMSSNIVSVVK